MESRRGEEEYRKGHSESGEVYEQMEKVQTRIFDTAYYLGLAKTKIGQYNDAITAFRKSLEFRSKETKALYHLAVAYYQTGEIADAAATFDRALDTAYANPGVPILYIINSHINMGLIQKLSGEYRAALKSYTTAKAMAHESLGARSSQ